MLCLGCRFFCELDICFTLKIKFANGFLLTLPNPYSITLLNIHTNGLNPSLRGNNHFLKMLTLMCSPLTGQAENINHLVEKLGS